MKKAMILAMAGLLMFLTGCAHVYRVRVDAINDGREIANQKYVIVPGDPNVLATDLQFREFVTYLTRALRLKGYTPAELNQTPDIEIYLSYGLGSPQPRVRSYTVPVWGQTGTEITTSENTYETKTGTNTVSTTNVTPEFGVTGFATQQETFLTYPKYVEIDAYQVNNAEVGEKMAQVWKTTIRSEGKRNEIRHVFPILIAAATKYLGGNTYQETEVVLTKNQPVVKMIKGIKE